MPEQISFGRLLKLFRENVVFPKALTQDDAAKQIGVSLRLYGGWERGEGLPRPEDLQRIVLVLGLDDTDEQRLYRAASQTVPRLHNLPPLNQLFTGRESYLAQIDALMKAKTRDPKLYGDASTYLPYHYEPNPNRYVMISGLGGIGKTQLALAYAHYCFRSETYRAVFWIDAGSRSAMASSFRSLEKSLSIFHLVNSVNVRRFLR